MIFRLIAYVLLLLSFMACTTDGEPAGIDRPEAEGATVRLSVIFATPTATRSSTTESGGSTDGTEVGTASESRISSAWVILGALPTGASAPAVVHSVHDITLAPSAHRQPLVGRNPSRPRSLPPIGGGQSH